MRSMVIIKATQKSEAGVLPSTELLTEMGKFNEELVNAGVMLAGKGLQPSSKSKRVRFSGQTRTVIHRPFTEIKELIAGFWLWQVRSMEEAVEWVKRCPNPMLSDCEIEIRRSSRRKTSALSLPRHSGPRGASPPADRAKNNPRTCRVRSSPFDVLTEPGIVLGRREAGNRAPQQKQGDTTMRFMMLVKHSENSGMPPQELMEAIGKLSEEAVKAGTMIASGGLAPTAQSTRVRISGGQLRVIDGPFTESKEIIGGYAQFELPSKEEALKAAVQFMELHRKYWPGWEGETEIRQVFGPEAFDEQMKQ